MAVHPPRHRRLLPLSVQERARLAAEAEAWRAEHTRREAERRPARLAVLGTGPALRDVAGAADCGCSCHPRAADLDLHDGGLACRCQQTSEERRRAWKELAEDLAVLEPDPTMDSARAELDRRAEELGVTAEWRLLDAPFVLTGQVDGRGFYLRERHGHYRVTIAADDDPAADAWELPAERTTVDIAEGDEDDLTGPDGGLDPARALTVAVSAVRSFLARRTCAHEQPRDDRQVFCSRCGIRLVEAHLWRGPLDRE